MAYRGTGTQADPAIPGASQGTATISDLLEILADVQNGSVGGNTTGPYYIKLDSDIDCYDDPNYIGYTTNLDFVGPSSTLSVVHFYSDTGNYIRGLTVKDQYFMTLLNNNQTLGTFTFIENISFIDCFFKPTVTGGSFLTTSSSVYQTFKNCKISVSMYPYTYYPMFGSVILQGCSVYLKYYGGGTNQTTCPLFNCINTTSALGSSNNNVIVVENYPIIQHASNGAPVVYWHPNSSYNAFILKNPIFKGSSSSVKTYYVMRQGSFNYFAVINPSFDSTLSNSVELLSYGTNYSVIAAPSYGTGAGTIKQTTDTAGQIYYATTAQMKDYDYLTGIGFIP